MKKFLVDRLAAYLFGGEVWGKLQGIINIVDDPRLDGATKRKEAVEAIERIGLGLVGYMLNLGIELAVAKLKMK